MGLPQLTLQGPAARQRQRIAEGRSCKLFEGVRYHLLARTVPGTQHSTTQQNTEQPMVSLYCSLPL